MTNDSFGNIGKLEDSVFWQLGHLPPSGSNMFPKKVADQRHESHKMNIVSFCFGFSFSFGINCLGVVIPRFMSSVDPTFGHQY